MNLRLPLLLLVLATPVVCDAQVAPAAPPATAKVNPTMKLTAEQARGFMAGKTWRTVTTGMTYEFRQDGTSVSKNAQGNTFVLKWVVRDDGVGVIPNGDTSTFFYFQSATRGTRRYKTEEAPELEIELVTQAAAPPGTAKRLEIIKIDPATPAARTTGEKVTVSIRYNNPGPNPVRVITVPFTQGKETPFYAISGSSPHPPGSGEVSRDFMVDSPATVDEVRVTMMDAETKKILETVKQPGQWVYTGEFVPRGRKAKPLSPFVPDFGEPAVAPTTIAHPQTASTQMVDSSIKLALTSLKGAVKLSPKREIILFAHPGKNFQVGVTVRYTSRTPSKLAANLLLEKAAILPPEVIQELRGHHNTTWHFDTETRPGYSSAEGDKEMTFDLIGRAPKEPGKYTFSMNVGLFTKQGWRTQVLNFYDVTLYTDKAQFESAPALAK